MYKSTPDEEEEPDWVASEREQFTKYRDTDNSGYLELEEVSFLLFEKVLVLGGGWI